MFDDLKPILASELEEIRKAGLYKGERVISSPQHARVRLADGSWIRNFCANNYLGLASHPAIVAAARDAIESHGYGLASVRFICGTQDIHKELESRIAGFLGVEDAILYSSCFAANGGLFEGILGAEDAVISDALNHASIIDGVRLCKANRYRYSHSDMADLEDCLEKAQIHRVRLIATDGVFSMDGDIANLPAICDLAERYRAVVMVDDSHATGFIGPNGRGTAELYGVEDKVDIITSTLGKALGGADGGFTASRREIVEMLRQRSRPYLFSNTLPPAIIGAGLAVFDLLSGSGDLRRKLEENTRYFRHEMALLGFTCKAGTTPIVPIMLHDAKVAQDFAAAMLEEGIYVIGFSYPIVPRGEARIRVQISAAHEREDLDIALAAFGKTGRRFGVIG